MNARIIVCCHKKDIMAKGGPYLPVHVGKALSSSELGIAGDDTGDHISGMNQSYCELTGLYWAWKNLMDSDVIGLVHYRRYFDFHGQCRPVFVHTSFPTSCFGELDLSVPEDILAEVEKGKVVAPRKESFRVTLWDHYCHAHYEKDLETLKAFIEETQPEHYRRAFRKVVCEGNLMRPFNMFIMNRTMLDAYCGWLFPVLDAMRERIDISAYDPVQKRIFGYMAERLFNVWLEAEHIATISKPVIWFNDAPDRSAGSNPLFRLCRSASNWLGLKLFKKA